MGMTSRSGRVLCDSRYATAWYAPEIGFDLCTLMDRHIDQGGSRFAKWLYGLGDIGQDLLLVWYGRRFDAVVTRFAPRLGLVPLALFTLLGLRKMIYFQFIRLDMSDVVRKPTLKRRIYTRAVGFMLGRAMLFAQVLTDWEKDSYADMLGVPRDRFVFVPWPLDSGLRQPRDLDAGDAGFVMSSGRSACDWPTLFEAARDAPWTLLVVCDPSELEAVTALNGDGRAKIMSNISLDEHSELVSRAVVYALVLREKNGSSGQIRLGDCNEVGTPVVATSVRGLSGYLVDGVNAVVIAPADAVALRRDIDALIADPARRRRLAASGIAYARTRTRAGYMGQLRDHILSATSS